MLIDLVKGKVKDDSGRLTDPDDYQNAIAEALKRYSKCRPQVLVEDIMGLGVNDYDLPDAWAPEFSVIEQVEYPAGLVPEQLVDPRDYKLYRTPSGLQLRLLAAAPAVGSAIRLTFTALQTEATLPSADLEAVANLAASVALRQLAAAFGQTGDPLIQADAVNYRSKGDEFARRAKEHEGLYNDHMGIGKDAPVKAAMATAPTPDSERMRLTHGRPLTPEKSGTPATGGNIDGGEF